VSYATLGRKQAEGTPSRSNAAARLVSGGLRIAERGDAYEQEADQVANEVMSGSIRHHWSLPTLSGKTPLHRQCSCGGSGECAQCKQEKDNTTLHRKATGPVNSGIAPPIVDEVLRSSGRPLDDQTRAHFEPRFGHDFSAVRLHTGARAAESARAIHALAYTVNNDIVFGNSEYAPWTASGQRLLAHELAHTIQQRASSRLAAVQRQTDDGDGADEDQDEQAGEVRDGDTPVITSRGQDAAEEDLETAADLGLLAQNSPQEMQAGGKKDPGKQKDDKKPAPPPTIMSIDVDLAAQQMTVHYSDGSTEGHAISSGKGQPGTDGDPCKTQTEKNCTPEGDFKIVSKGNEGTKNSHGDAMAWYVELGGDKVINGRGIGIHDSQPVGGGPRSHGCVRVGDSKADKAFAKKINESVNNGTVVHIKGKAPTKPYGKKPASKPSKPKARK
jgi:lipoprotein-anchoring transpeptidase ErfK/SrfK